MGGSKKLRTTHTFAELQVSAEAYDEIAALLRAAGYDHAFVDGVIDMHGIGLTKPPLDCQGVVIGGKVVPFEHLESTIKRGTCARCGKEIES